MDTDRELLEWAFKAYRPGENYVRMVNDAGYDWWNPLKDSGQALELAVKLAIDFKIRNEATWWDHQESEGVVCWRHEPHNGDPLAATRRAIVRAAAEIGKAMK